MDKNNAIRSESVLNRNAIRVYTDGSKLDERVGAGFYAEYTNNSPKQAFFHLGVYSTVFQAEVLAISLVAKDLLLEKCTTNVLEKERLVYCDDKRRTTQHIQFTHKKTNFVLKHQ